MTPTLGRVKLDQRQRRHGPADKPQPRKGLGFVSFWSGGGVGHRRRTSLQLRVPRRRRVPTIDATPRRAIAPGAGTE